MARNPYARTSTPELIYEGEIDEFGCFRMISEGEDPLNLLLYKGDIVEFVLKQGVEHKIGNRIRGHDLPENKGLQDVFVMIHRDDVRKFVLNFPVERYSPYKVY